MERIILEIERERNYPEGNEGRFTIEVGLSKKAMVKRRG